MKFAGAVTLVCILFLTAERASAQDISLPDRAVVTDVNVVASYLSKEQLLNSDVMNMAAITCSTMGVARERLVASQSVTVAAKNYPSADEAAKIDLEQFIKVETESLSAAGVSPQAISLTQVLIRQSKVLPEKAPTKEQAEGSVAGLESVACDLKVRRVANLAQPASAETQKLAWSLGKGILGLSVLVVDVLATTGTANPGVLVIAAVSVGWGWTRVEESFFEVKDQSGSAFK